MSNNSGNESALVVHIEIFTTRGKLTLSVTCDPFI